MVVINDDRIQVTVTTMYDGKGNAYNLHFYSRYIGESTELWIFGCGLGDQTMIAQIGDGFLEYLDKVGDPELGKIMFSVGEGESAFYAYDGDYNLAWVWGQDPKSVPHHLARFMGKKPELILNSYRSVMDRAEEFGYKCMRFRSAAGRFFTPLGLPRQGLGFAGLEKSPEQMRIVLKPAMKREGFDWISRDPDRAWLPLAELNEWYNSKQILFGMVDESRHGRPFMPSRFFETLASGTPLITYKLHGLEEHYGMGYPYMTESPEQTEALIDEILSDYERVLEEIDIHADYIRKHHSYLARVTQIIDRLKEGL